MKNLGRTHSVIVTSEGQLHFRYGTELIPFLRVPRRKGTEKVVIKVLPDGFVEVAAPAEMDDKSVVQAVQQKARWVRDQLLKLESDTPEQGRAMERFQSGSSHYYLGRQYVLKVSVDPVAPEEVKLIRGRFVVRVHYRDPYRVRAALNRWYEAHAMIVFRRRLELCLKKAVWVERPPDIQVAWMNQQWGNCTPDGDLNLNIALVRASLRQIDYVISHELCHVAEHNHSPRFYQLLDSLVPNWKVTKRSLDERWGPMTSPRL